MPKLLSSITLGTHTLEDVYKQWIWYATNDVWNAARANVSGKLLKVRSGKLRDSIFQNVSASGASYSGEVGTSYGPGVIWEQFGVRGPLAPKNGAKAMVMPMANYNFAKWRSKNRYVFRSRTYTRTPFVGPKHFLELAMLTELTGNKGLAKLNNLGYSVASVVGYEIAQKWGKQNFASGNFQITVK